MVKMKANDTLFVSSFSSENILPGAEFDVSADEAERMEKAGLASRVGGAKAEKTAPANKAEKAAPENKGLIGADAFDHDGNGRPGGAPKGGNRRRAKGKM